jgi:hypothetical protein
MFSPGVYFGLSEDLYRADPALGSTDIKRLAQSPPDYWFGSVHNPLRESREPTPGQKFGTAIHKFVLEGREAFEARYAPTDSKGNTKEGKAELSAIEAEGKIALPRKDWDRIKLSGTMVRANPEISTAFTNGFSEVSVFWERDGIRRKARFDYLKTRALVDLKSDANRNQQEFVTACRNSIGRYRYDIQAAHYCEGRAQLRAFVSDGAMYGDYDYDWLFGASVQDAWAFVWIFYQSEGAPLTWGTTLSPGNGLFDFANASIAKAEENYRAFKDRFGLDQPWVLAEPLAEIDVNDLPAWSFK